MEARNPKVTSFIRTIDEDRLAMQRRNARNSNLCVIASLCRAGLLTKFRRVERNRIVQTPQPKSKFLRLPKKVPIDWYDPDFYNSRLTLQERHDVYVGSKGKIGLPPSELCTKNKWADWRKMDNDEFQRKFGSSELQKYDIPTTEDITLLKEYEKRGEFDPDFDFDGDDEEEEEEEQQQEQQEQHEVDVELVIPGVGDNDGNIDAPMEDIQ